MEVLQLSVLLDKAAGRLADVAEVLAAGGVNVRTLALADMAEFGILRLVVDDTERARLALKAAGFAVNTTAVLAVGVPDAPGGMARVLRVLGSRGLAVDYLYAYSRHRGEEAIVIFCVVDRLTALIALQEEGLHVLDGPEIHGA
jgi:hypothetical protein